MTCKDAINSDTNSEDKDLYLVSEVTRYNKIFESDLECTNNISDIEGDSQINIIKFDQCWYS